MNSFRAQILILACSCLAVCLKIAAQDDRYGVTLKVSPGKILSMDEYTDTWLKDKNTLSLSGEMKYVSLPEDSDDFAADYGYPQWGLGVRYGFNHHTTMHKSPGDGWPLPEASYDTRLGNIITLYGSFERAIYRNRHWQFDYSLNIGVGWSRSKYNPYTAVDNELIGSRWLIFFGAGVHTTYHVTPQWGVMAGIELGHHSNGSLNKPNKGANALGPVVGVVHTPYYNKLVEESERRESKPFPKSWYANVAIGIGAKTIIEDWNLYAYETPEGEPGFHTDHFKRYAIYTLQTDLMCRYARRWASGVGFDVFYGSHYKRVKAIEDQQGYTDYHHSPWSLGVALKHEAFYHDFSLAMSVGLYLKRSIGVNADIVEKPYYERIGLKYKIRPLGGITVGANVAAHLLRADFTEVVLGFPFNL